MSKWFQANQHTWNLTKTKGFEMYFS
jgi:hypothetical protein